MAIKRSQRFAALLLFIHATVAAAVYLTAIPLPARLALLLLISLSLFYHLARDVLLILPNSWCEVTFLPGERSIVTRDGSRFPFRIASKIIVSPHFVVLRGTLEGHHLPSARVIFPDALDTGVFRELCVRLRFS